MKKRKRILSLITALALCLSVMPFPVYATGSTQNVAGVGEAFLEGSEDASNLGLDSSREDRGLDGLCEHHLEHDEVCGYKENDGDPDESGLQGNGAYVSAAACSHEHDDGCFEEVDNCIHEHGQACYGDEVEIASGSNAKLATPSEAAELVECPHICDDGCVKEKLACPHIHDDDCGYVEAWVETICGYVCEICSIQDGLVKTIAAWEWVDEWEMLDLENNVLALPGASAENPASFDAVVSMLPESILAMVDEEWENVPLAGWESPGYPELAYDGNYRFDALLPDGYELGEDAPVLAVTAELGGAAVYSGDSEVRYSTDGGTTWTEDSLMNAVWACYGSNENVQIELLDDLVLNSENWTSEQQQLGYKDSTWTIDGKGNTITRGEGARMLFCVKGEDSVVTLKDITIDGGAVWSSDDPADRTNSGMNLRGYNAHLLYVDNGATLILDDGTVLQNSDLGNLSYGAAVVVGYSDDGNGTFIMEEGSIIRNCTAADGGAVCIYGAGDVFEMRGGKIYGNYASKSNSSGGAVYDSGGTFTMTSGEIYDNISINNSGGVVVNGSFTMSGGTITGNRSGLGGGGITAFNGTVTLEGGSVTDNTITGSMGGGVLVYGGSLSVSGDTVVFGNTKNGVTANNVYLGSGKTITISDSLGDDAMLGVTTAAAPSDGVPVDITGSNLADYSGNFQSDNASYSVINSSTDTVQLSNTPVSLPGAPQNLSVVVGTTPGQVELSWETPTDNGGSIVTGYEVSSDGGASWTAVAGTSYTVTGLANGTEYTFQVRAVNIAGGGAAAEATATTFLPSYVITVSGNETACGSVTGGGTFDEGVSATVTATANSGYRFVRWTENGVEVSADAEYSFTVTGARNLVAVFEVEYILTVENGTGDGAYLSKEQVSITADAAPEGMEFDKWISSNGGVFSDENSMSATFTMPAGNVTVTATYKAVTRITGVEVTPSAASVEQGSSCQFTAVVSGTGSYDPSITWSVSGNADSGTIISENGLLAIASQETASSITVKATAVGDASQYGTAVVAVLAVRPLVPVEMPVIAPNGGTFVDKQVVAITCATPGAIIYYTVDSSDPADPENPNRLVYGAAFEVDTNTAVRAIGAKSGMIDSEEVSAVFIRAGDEKKVKSRIERQEITEVPDTLKHRFPTVQDMIRHLEEEIARVLSTQVESTEENTEVHDVKLQFSMDGGKTWIDATEENFPEDGLDVLLPYPDGTSRHTHNFKAVHMFTVDSDRLGTTAGDTEEPPVTKTVEGLRFQVRGLSPIAIGYEEIKKEESFEGDSISSGGSSDSGNDADPGSWKQDGKGWWYQYPGGSYEAGTFASDGQGGAAEYISWKYISGAWWAFGADGYLKEGWVLDRASGHWYYMDVNAGRAGGWHQDVQDGCWYYLDPATGAMVTGWQLIGGRWYYFNPFAEAPTWHYDGQSGQWLYDPESRRKPYGSMYRNEQTPDGYVVGEDGVWEG